MIPALLANLALAQTTAADPALNAQHYRAPIDAEQTQWADDAGMRHGFSPVARLVAGYARRPLVDYDDPTWPGLVRDVFQLDAAVGFGWEWVRFGLDLPVFAYVSSDVIGDAAGVGDLAADLKLTAIDPARGPIGLAFVGRLTFPTTTVPHSVGDRAMGWEAKLVLDGQAGPLRIIGNIGTRGVPRLALDEFTYDDQLIWRGALSWTIRPTWGLNAEAAGSLTWNAPRVVEGAPVEGMIGAWGRVNHWLVAQGGIGAGFTRGIGSPQVRALATFAVVRERDRVQRPKPPTDWTPWTSHVIVETVDQDGRPLAAAVTVRNLEPWAAPAGASPELETIAFQTLYGTGSSWVYPGTLSFHATAAGYRSAWAERRIGPDDEIRVRLVLYRSQAQLEGDFIHVGAVLFDTAESVVRPDAAPVLDDVAHIILAHPEIRRVAVEGHSDERGDARYNLRLSQDRAASVVRELVARGVPRSRLDPIGFGEALPLIDASTPTAWAVNRRVVFRVERFDR